MVITPLKTVTRHAQRVGSRGDLQSRLNMTRADEIGQLSREFDGMVEALAVARRQEMEASRVAGESQVAKEVLHNVGNVLNTVNVAAETISGKLRRSELPTLGLAAQMLLDHQGDLGEFITRDPRGLQIPAFLCELSKALTDDHQHVLAELSTLNKAVEHIRGVVMAQQVRSGSSMVSEAARAADIVQEAIGICQQALDENNISVVTQFQAAPDVNVDRHKMLQILLNLISNAKHALIEAQRADKEIVLAVRAADGEAGCVQVEVKDNGVGIAGENLPKVFNFGFITRAGGHGYGLHSAINAAREMSGSLQTQSDGPGTGATFTLTLPAYIQKDVA